ncbi:MAG: pyruvate kinase [Alphaproteobacteria bacterium]
MGRFRCGKIVATLGPASASPEMIEALFSEGVDVFRLNFSHGTHEDHAKTYQTIRSLEQRKGRPIGILMDLQGPKFRIGTFEAGSVVLEKGQYFDLSLCPIPGSHQGVTLPHPELFQVLHPGARLLLDDGRLALEVIENKGDRLVTTVALGGTLSNRKGVNVPQVLLPLSPLTGKDKADLAFGLALGVDWVALSFVQKPEDIEEAKALIQQRAGVIAKLEKPQAIQHLDAIVEIADGIMIARGDLGVEMPPEDVPSIQKRIIRTARLAGKPVIVATQMLDSMVHAPTPTRAEASDVATAIYDGADAVMLSAESASGNYPVEAVSMMHRILMRVEADPIHRTLLEASRSEPESTTSDAITAAARQVAHTIQAAAVVTFTQSGATTLRASRERPESPILGITPSLETARRLTLAWGVYAVYVETCIATFSEMVQKGCHIALEEGFAQIGERIVVTAGVPFGISGSTNILRIARIRQEP